MTATEKNFFSNIDIDLEGGTDLGVSSFDDLSVLDDAAKHHINLDALEKIEFSNDVFNEMPMQKQAEKDTQSLKKEKHLWQNMDVSLADMIRLVLDNSERPVAVVSDDKIIYMNKTMMMILGITDQRQVLDVPFLSFVDKSQWNSLAENIGEMLTSGKKYAAKLRAENGKIINNEIQAIYLPDTSHFSFILIGSHIERDSGNAIKNLYDELTGLPNFFLWEDRVQVAVNNEIYKKASLPKNIVAVVGLAIDDFDKKADKFWKEKILNDMATGLVMSLKKNCTVARGMKYQFWILFPDISDKKEFLSEFEKIKEVMKKAAQDYNIIFSVGVNFYPTPAKSAKKLIEQAIVAVEKAKLHKENYIEFCEEETKKKGSF